VAYRVNFGESLEASLQRLANERLGDALCRLGDGYDDDPRVAVHEARKDIKKARALLRLYRDELDGATYRRENGVLRDAGRELSVLRDEDVLRDTVDALAEHSGRDLGDLRERASGERESVNPELAVEAARNRLTRVIARLDSLAVSGTDHRALLDGLDRTYRRGVKRFARAQRRPTDERLHDWRKRAKDLRYQQQLFRPAFEELLGAQAKAAQALSELLGDDHDLAVLAERLEADDPAHPLIAARRTELQEQAFRLGRRVYAESPKRFRRRMRNYVEAARGDSRAELSSDTAV
jgi:CHAD domain-containing protein